MDFGILAVFRSLSSCFVKYERVNEPYASAITANIQSSNSRSNGWISSFVPAPFPHHKPSYLPTQLLTTLADNPRSASVISS